MRVTLREIAEMLDKTPDEFLDMEARSFAHEVNALTEIMEAALALAEDEDGDS
jgi:hypothetical protein